MTKVNCASGQAPVIKWQYPQETQQERFASEYDVTGSCPYETYAFRVEREPMSGLFVFAPALSGYVSGSERLTRYPGTNNFYLAVEARNREYELCTARRSNRAPRAEGVIQLAIFGANSNQLVIGAEQPFPASARIESVAFVQFHGYQSLTNDVIFTIKNNNNVVFTRTTDIIPTITTECRLTQQCPPNTCDVLCGNTICCYNTDGISVFNYPNT